MEKNNGNKGVKIVVYKKMLPGDLKKFHANSNLAKTGGGARDIRFSPGPVFASIFNKMFEMNEKSGLLVGELHWTNLPNTQVEVYPPTDSRNTEIRISKVHQCFPSSIIPSDFEDCILLIVLNSKGEVWPHFTTSRSLREDEWHPSIKKHVLEGLIAKRRKGVAANGFIDFENDEVVYTNGKRLHNNS